MDKKYVKKPVLRRTLCILTILAVSVLFAAACSRKKSPVTDDAGEPTASVTEGGQIPSGAGQDEGTPTPAADDGPEATAAPEPTEELLPTLMEDDPDDSDDNSSIPGSDLEPPEDDGDDRDGGETAVPEPVSDPDARRSGDWQDTFLVWIPEFTGAVYGGVTAEETFDSAVFYGAEENEVTEYIRLLAEAGFVLSPETDTQAGDIYYSAFNDDNWAVRVSFSDGVLTISSGYIPDDTGSGQRLAHIWETTFLAQVPAFADGEFASDGAVSSDRAYFAVFDAVSIEAVRDYVALLAEAGFTGETDEGDEDGFVWYYAENGDGAYCDVTYYDSVLRIESGREK